VGVSSTNNSDWTVLRLTCSEAMVVSSNNSACLDRFVTPMLFVWGCS
jgi:hypothetical protein